jgi:hypothetical protein
MNNRELKYNIYFEIQPLYYVSRLMGLAPFSIKKKKCGETEIHYSHSDIILTTTLNIVLLMGLCLSEFVVADFVDHTYPAVIRALWFSSALSTYCTCIITLILNITIHRKHFPLILKRICIIDSKLFNDGSSEKHYKSRRSGTNKQLLLAALILTINCLYFIYYFFKVGIIYKVCFIFRTLCNIIFFLIICQYISLVLVLKARYKYFVSIFSNLLIGKDNLYDTDLTHISDSGLSGGCFLFDANIRYFEVFQIREMRKLYSQLHDVLWLVNKYYGLEVLLVIISIIVNFIPIFFSSIILIHNANVHQGELEYYIQIALRLCLCMPLLFMFVWIVSCCHLVTVETYKLLLCIHKMQIYSNVMQGTIIELRSFISQLKDMKTEFSVCGFFTLNLPFLCATLGVITTYVTVLFQLK